MTAEKNVFQKILDKEINSTIHYEDERCIVISDIHPKAPIHLLVIPRKPLKSFDDVEPEDKDLLFHLMTVGRKQIKKMGAEGYKLQFNVGSKGGQEIFHLHLHVLGWN